MFVRTILYRLYDWHEITCHIRKCTIFLSTFDDCYSISDYVVSSIEGQQTAEIYEKMAWQKTRYTQLSDISSICVNCKWSYENKGVLNVKYEIEKNYPLFRAPPITITISDCSHDVEQKTTENLTNKNSSEKLTKIIRFYILSLCVHMDNGHWLYQLIVNYLFMIFLMFSGWPETIRKAN